MTRIPEPTRLEILRLLLQGLSYREIAQRLGVSKTLVGDVARQANSVRPSASAQTDTQAPRGRTDDRTDADSPPTASMDADGRTAADADSPEARPSADTDARTDADAPSGHLDKKRGRADDADTTRTDADEGLGDGLEEFLPAPEGRKLAKPRLFRLPLAQGCDACGTRWTLEPDEEDPRRCPECEAPVVYACGACDARWTLEAEERQVKRCPACGVKLDA